MIFDIDLTTAKHILKYSSYSELYVLKLSLRLTNRFFINYFY